MKKNKAAKKIANIKNEQNRLSITSANFDFDIYKF